MKSSSIAKDRALIFCTAWAEGDPSRHRNWAAYYADYFKGEPVDLLVINDGPALAGEPVEMIGFPNRLGRPSLMCMPGFKRSFYEGVRTAARRDYRHLAHVESDCWLRQLGRQDFLAALFAPGHKVPWLASARHCESALQVLNDPVSLQYFLSRYGGGDFEERYHFEHTIDALLKPTYFLNGERWARTPEGARLHKPEHQFVANMPHDAFRWLDARFVKQAEKERK